MNRLALWLAAALLLVGLPPRPARAADPGTLQLVSWNLEWLADPAALSAGHFWRICAAHHERGFKPRDDLPYCDAYTKARLRSADDYARVKLAALRSGLAGLAAQGLDVLAVQEVQNPAALQAVLPPGYHVACFTTRVNAQNLGFALRDGLRADASCREIRSLSLEDDPSGDHPVRRGLELTLRRAGQRMTLLNVHLKASCPGGPLDAARSTHCALLQRQAAPLEAWVEDQARRGHAFLIVGDWNRDLEAEIRGHYPARHDGSDPRGPLRDATEVRNLWPEINDGAPPASAMELADVDRSAAAHHACFGRLDQLAVSRTLLARLDPATLSDGTLAARLLPRPAEASDHCPLQARLPWR